MSSSYAHATSIGRLLSHESTPSPRSPLFGSASGRPRAASTGSSWTASSAATNGTTAAAMRGNARRCGFPECLKTAKPGGLCISHGGGKKCSVEGCTTSVVSRGFCVAHGGGKRCQRDGCTKSAQTGGFCWIHGGGKKCGHDGCTKRAQSGGACISHGGGKRCRIDGCNKVVQYEGLCVGHGGYRKCLSMNCIKKALPNGYCQTHGGNAKCHAVDCSKKAVHGGFCGQHRVFGSPQQAPRSRSSSAGDSPVLLERSPLHRRHDNVATISPLMPLASAAQQAGRDWSRAIHEAKHSSTFTPGVGSDHRYQQTAGSEDPASMDIARGLTMAGTSSRLPTVEDMQRSCSLNRSVSPLRMLGGQTRPSADRIVPLLFAVESATIAIKREPMNESPRESLNSHHCADHTCGRFAKIDGLCLLHHQLHYPLQHHTRAQMESPLTLARGSPPFTQSCVRIIGGIESMQ